MTIGLIIVAVNIVGAELQGIKKFLNADDALLDLLLKGKNINGWTMFIARELVIFIH